MELSSALGLVAVVILVLANGFFVATEFAIVAVRRSRLEQLAAEGHPSAEAAKQVVGHLDAYIAACQLGITMASLALGWIGEPAFAHLIEPPLEALVGQFAPAAAHGVAVGTAFAIITALHIVIGELAPKGLALQRPEATALWIARPIQAFYVLFRWPITLLNNVGNGVLKLVGLDPAAGHEMVHSVEELRLLVTASQQGGTVEESEARIASRAFELGEQTAGSLMTPRTEIEGVAVTASLAELLATAATTTHSRLLVYEQSLDDVLGALYVRDLFRVLDRPAESVTARTLLRPVLVVPETKHADDLLDEMRAARRQLALVIDEYGGTAGIVTLENLVEALVGRIEDEPPIGVDAPPPITMNPDGSLILDGLTHLEELEEIAGITLPEEVHEEVDTLGGLVMATLDRIPIVGDEVIVCGRTLRVEKLDGRRVEAVRLFPSSSRDVEESTTAADHHAGASPDRSSDR
jgi:CBS domain containing-hemolysin-like protein